MSRRLVIALVLILAGCSGRREAGVGTPAGADAEAVAQAFLDALAAERWRAAARLVEESAVAECHAHWLRMAWPERIEWTVEEMMRMSPGMPREAAEWTVERMGADGEVYGFAAVVSEVFSGVRSLDELRALDPVDAMARRLEAGDPRSLQRRMRPTRPRSGADFVAEQQPARARVIGWLPLRSDLAYVLYREQERSRLLPLTGGPERWRLLPAGEPFARLPGACSGEWRATLSEAVEQAPGEGEAVAVVRRAASAMEQQDWEAAAGLADAGRLRQWQERTVSFRRAMERQPTVEALMEQTPAMPRVMAEYQVETMRRSLEMSRAMEGEYGALSPTDLAALAPRRALAMALEARHPAYRLRNLLDHLEPGSEEQEEAEAVLRAFDSRVRAIGQVVADSTAYVLYVRDQGRPSGSLDPLVAHPQVAHLQRTAEGWRIDPEDMLYRYAENFGVIRTPAEPDPR